jgi:hypothetical protein
LAAAASGGKESSDDFEADRLEPALPPASAAHGAIRSVKGLDIARFIATSPEE